ncbi:hypothetical protein BLA29_013188, partial [Euroglyphus maynei]
APKVTLQQLIDDNHVQSINHNLTNGDNGNGYAIRGRQLQLYCNISANPMVLATDIHWYKDSKLITDNHMIVNNNNKTNNDGKF